MLLLAFLQKTTFLELAENRARAGSKNIKETLSLSLCIYIYVYTVANSWDWSGSSSFLFLQIPTSMERPPHATPHAMGLGSRVKQPGATILENLGGVEALFSDVQPLRCCKFLPSSP